MWLSICVYKAAGLPLVTVASELVVKGYSSPSKPSLYLTIIATRMQLLKRDGSNICVLKGLHEL